MEFAKKFKDLSSAIKVLDEILLPDVASRQEMLHRAGAGVTPPNFLYELLGKSLASLLIVDVCHLSSCLVVACFLLVCHLLVTR